MDITLIAYIVLVLVYRFSETWAMTKAGTVTRRPAQDSAWLIVAPYWLVVIGSAAEYVFLDEPQPGAISLAAGVALFAAATLVRVRAHLDLGVQLSKFLEEGKAGGLVTAGLYGTIRHPLYLANLLLFLACPTFLAARLAWLSVLLGLVGAVTRIETEERYLQRNFDGYAAYAEKTWKLIPRIY